MENVEADSDAPFWWYGGPEEPAYLSLGALARAQRRSISSSERAQSNVHATRAELFALDARLQNDMSQLEQRLRMDLNLSVGPGTPTAQLSATPPRGPPESRQ